jgi:hypothetical protein
MSLLNKVKSKLSQKYQASKEERQRKQLNEAALKKELEEARWQGRRKGMIERAKTESYRQARTPQTRSIGGGFSKLGKVGEAANRGLDFMNQDFGTGFGTTTSKPASKKGKKKKKTSMFDIGF